METPVIRYNLKDRGRQHTGQSRNFNIKAICDSINGAATQEFVGLRNMVGYYGHLPRVRYGMTPVEGGIEGGKYTPVEPAFVTTYLKADYDGNVEHRAEFLDTAAGQLSRKLWDGKVGGFSSAIDERKPEFYGFDFVIAPNFAGNSYRGVALDDAWGGGGIAGMTYDDVYAAEQAERDSAIIVMLDSIKAERDAANAVIEHLSAENEQFLCMLAAKGIDGNAALALDSARPVVAGSRDGILRMRRDSDDFRGAALPQMIGPDEPSASLLDSANPSRLASYFRRRA